MAENGALSSIAAKERRVRRRRRSSLWRALRRVFWAIAVVAALPLVLLPLYGTIDPPGGTVMLWKRLAGAPIEKDWAALAEISPNLVRAVLAPEDARFCSHNGIDFVELQNALDDEDGRFRGASTITMQTVKNLFLWTGRDWVRKAIEAPLALYADFILPKRRIMEIYLNIVDGTPASTARRRLPSTISPCRPENSPRPRRRGSPPSCRRRRHATPPIPAPAARRIANRIAETIALSTILALVRDTGVRVHLCRLSRAEGVAMVRAAKQEGLPVTCDVGDPSSAPVRRRHRLVRSAGASACRRCARRAIAPRCARAWPTARSTSCAPTTRRSTTTRSSCRSARPSRARPVSNCCCR